MTKLTPELVDAISRALLEADGGRPKRYAIRISADGVPIATHLDVDVTYDAGFTFTIGHECDAGALDYRSIEVDKT